MKRRLRFGIKLSWPITNIAIFVIYVPQDLMQKIMDAAAVIRLALNVVAPEVAARFVCEDSTK